MATRRRIARRSARSRQWAATASPRSRGRSPRSWAPAGPRHDLYTGTPGGGQPPPSLAPLPFPYLSGPSYSQFPDSLPPLRPPPPSLLLPFAFLCGVPLPSPHPPREKQAEGECEMGVDDLTQNHLSSGLGPTAAASLRKQEASYVAPAIAVTLGLLRQWMWAAETWREVLTVLGGMRTKK